MLGIAWGPSRVRGSKDVGGYQVRSTNLVDGKLILRPDREEKKGDSKEDIYIFVTGAAPTFEIVGWITGEDGMQSRWLDSPGFRPSAFFIPQSALNPMDTLPKI